MAGLMSRTSLIVKAKFSKLLNRAENPNETLDYSYEQMQTQLQNVKRGVADVVTAKKRLELQTAKLEQNVVKLETQARQALAANREDLARAGARAQGGRPGSSSRASTSRSSSSRTSRRSSFAGQQSSRPGSRASARRRKSIKAQYSAAEAQVRSARRRPGSARSMAGHRPGDPAREGQDRGAAGAGVGDRRADDERRARGLHGRRPDPARPRARADLARRTRSTTELAQLKAEVGSGDAAKELGDGPTRPRPQATPATASRRGAGEAVRRGRSATSSSAGRSSRSRRPTGSSRSRPRRSTLDVECGLKPAGVGAVDLQAAARPATSRRPTSDIEELLEGVATGRRARRSTARRTRSASSGS